MTPLPFLPLQTLPDKKPKKDEPSTSKSKKMVERSVTDKKMEELDQKWSSGCLEVLLMSKTFQPTFSSSVKSHHHILLRLPLLKTLNPFFNRPHQSALARTSLLCISLPASSVKKLLLQSALDGASLLHCISLPASSDPTLTDRNLHPSALVLTPLL